jgi:hypothetical protein
MISYNNSNKNSTIQFYISSCMRQLRAAVRHVIVKCMLHRCYMLGTYYVRSLLCTELVAMALLQEQHRQHLVHAVMLTEWPARLPIYRFTARQSTGQAPFKTLHRWHIAKLYSTDETPIHYQIIAQQSLLLPLRKYTCEH